MHLIKDYYMYGSPCFTLVDTEGDATVTLPPELFTTRKKDPKTDAFDQNDIQTGRLLFLDPHIVESKRIDVLFKNGTFQNSIFVSNGTQNAYMVRSALT